MDVKARGSVHAHVEFNPWYERQFAIIDESGKWRIWDIEGRQRRDLRMQTDLAVEEYTYGRISSTDDETGKGWGRIVWGGDLNTIMACDRKRAGLFDIRVCKHHHHNTPPLTPRAPKSPQSKNSTIPLPTDPSMIVDLKHSPSFETHGYDAFILTSTALSWLDVRQSRKPLINIPHYRHHDDYSLSMELLDTNNTTITAFLHSRFNTLVTTHCLIPSETPTLLGPPKLLQSPIPADATTPVSYGFSMLPCKLIPRGKPDEAAQRYLADENLRFFTSFGIGKDLGITQRVYASQDLQGKTPEFKLVPKGSSKISARGKGASRFVVDSDSDMELEMRGLSFDAGEEEDTDSTIVEFGNSCTGESSKRFNKQRVDLADIYRYAFTADSEPLKTAREDDTENSIEGSVRHIKALLEKRADRGDLGIISLLNLRQPAHLYDQLDEFESRVRDLLDEDALKEFKIKSLIPSSEKDEFLITHAHSEDPVDLVEKMPVHISVLPLYNKLLATWVQPLPENTPGKVRLRREQLCRMLATEMWLSSIGLHLEPSPEDLPPVPPEPPAAPIDSVEPVVVPPESLPEPLQRIRTYANVSTRITLPEGLQGVLDKWEVGEDPWEYEYAPDEASAVRKKKRSHRRKSSARRGDAVRGDVESWSLQQSQMSSQPPAIAISSQPAQRAAGKAASQVGSSQGGLEVEVMSQVERGKHGGRVAARKKRKTGF